MFGHIDQPLGGVAKSMAEDDGCALIGFVPRRDEDGAVAPLAGCDVAAHSLEEVNVVVLDVVVKMMTAAVVDVNAIE